MTIRVRLRSVFAVAAALGAAAAAVGVVLLYTGFYDVSAARQHLAITYRLLDIGLTEAIERRAQHVDVPALGAPAQVDRGLALYRDHCVQCHGAPGVGPAPFALGLTPLPKNIVLVARERDPAELYWVVKNGIKMTAMPAWEFRLSEDDLWALVAVMEAIAMMTPQEYRTRSAGVGRAHRRDAELPAGIRGDPRRGQRALAQYACTTCHQIPGVVGAVSPVGPPLARIATRGYIAGVLPNTPENMERWLRSPQDVNPRSAMPNLGVTARDARDMAAFLGTLE